MIRARATLGPGTLFLPTVPASGLAVTLSSRGRASALRVPFQVLQELRAFMWELAGPSRSADTLEKAREALGKLRSISSIEALGVCAQDPISNLRKAAIAAMGEIAEHQCIPYIEKALEDNDPDVRKIARWAMTKVAA